MTGQKPRDPEHPPVPPKNAETPDPNRPTEVLDTLPWTEPEGVGENLVGKSLAQYTITERLGEGGMGVVYKAQDTRLNRPVALKFLAPQLLSDPQAKQRFLREARAAAALDDPHICTVHDISEAGGHTFIVMNYVEGKSLKERIASNPPSVPEALEITRQIATGLAKAHSHGIIHRDIKPANILFTADGQVKIADFGLAKLASQTRLTRTGAAVGTLAYMSPEQAKGKEVDRRADIWSLGVVLYEMLTGELPFRGNNERAMTRSILKKAPKPISDFRPEVSLELEDLVGKSLSKRPGKRYPEVDAFLKDLEEQIRVAEQERKPSRWVAVERFFRRRSTKRVLAAAMLAAVAGGALYVAQQIIPPREVPRIMVAKWENTSGREDLDWISGALMSGLIQTLGDVEEYNVISRQTVAATVDALQLASPTPPIPFGTAREVGANYLVSGSFKPGGDWLILDCELTDVSRNGVVVDSWSVELADSTRIHEAVVQTAVDVASALNASWSQDPRTSPSTQPTASTAALKHYERALAAEERHEYAEAVEELFQAVEHDSTFAEAHFGIARLTMEKDIEQKHYTLAMKYRLRAPPITRKLIEAQGLVWDNQVDPAIEKFEEIVQEDPEQVTARKELARLYYGKRRFSETLSEYTVLHEISPLDFSFYQDWAMANVLNGRPDDAADLINSWRRRYPEQEEPFVTYLVLCQRISRYREGVSLCDSLAGIDQSRPFVCGWLYERVGRLKEAEKIFSGLVESPDSSLPSTRGYAYLAWLSYRQQRYASGLEYVETALERWDNSWYRWLAGSLAAAAGKVDRAREHAEAIARLDPAVTDTTAVEAVGNRRWYYHLLGLIDMAEGNLEEAEKQFATALRFTTRIDDPEFRTTLGRAYLESGDLDKAVRELETVYNATPTFPEAWLYLGKTYLLKEEYDRSMEVFRDLQDLWSRADTEDPLNMELKRLMDVASANR